MLDVAFRVTNFQPRCIGAVNAKQDARFAFGIGNYQLGVAVHNYVGTNKQIPPNASQLAYNWGTDSVAAGSYIGWVRHGLPDLTSRSSARLARLFPQEAKHGGKSAGRTGG